MRRIIQLILLLFFLFFYSFYAFGEENIVENKSSSFFRVNENEKFSTYQPTYFIFGKDDIKIQISFKYRMAKSIPFFFGFTQKMFWNIYDGSKPFKDINYLPETFYRFLDRKNNAFRTLDMGYMHTSNGKKDSDSRSFDRIFIRSNYLTKFNRHNLDLDLMIFNIYNHELTNYNIRKHMGFWDFKLYMTNVIVHNLQNLDLEFRLFGGEKIVDLKNGAYQIGLIYNLESVNMNPALYLQFYEGYCENLLTYSIKHSQLRFGFLLTY